MPAFVSLHNCKTHLTDKPASVAVHILELMTMWQQNTKTVTYNNAILPPHHFLLCFFLTTFLRLNSKESNWAIGSQSLWRPLWRLALLLVCVTCESFRLRLEFHLISEQFSDKPFVGADAFPQ